MVMSRFQMNITMTFDSIGNLTSRDDMSVVLHENMEYLTGRSWHRPAETNKKMRDALLGACVIWQIQEENDFSSDDGAVLEIRVNPSEDDECLDVFHALWSQWDEGCVPARMTYELVRIY